VESSSSINSKDLQSFGQQMEGRAGEGVKIPSPCKPVGEEDPEFLAQRMFSDTPGVGSYKLSA
jgi:hypothetical protein